MIYSLIKFRIEKDGSINVLHPNGSIEYEKYNIDSFSFLKRKMLKEMILVASKELIKRNDKNMIISLEKYEVKAYKFYDVIVIAHENVSEHIVFNMIKDYNNGINIDLNNIDDRIEHVKKNLDETIVVVKKTLDSILERGIKIDHLIHESEDLSSSSKLFYKNAKNSNRCCSLM